MKKHAIMVLSSYGTFCARYCVRPIPAVGRNGLMIENVTLETFVRDHRSALVYAYSVRSFVVVHKMKRHVARLDTIITYYVTRL